jgi:hypothetical protein
MAEFTCDARVRQSNNVEPAGKVEGSRKTDEAPAFAASIVEQYGQGHDGSAAPIEYVCRPRRSASYLEVGYVAIVKRFRASLWPIGQFDDPCQNGDGAGKQGISRSTGMRLLLLNLGTYGAITSTPASSRMRQAEQVTRRAVVLNPAESEAEGQHHRNPAFRQWAFGGDAGPPAVGTASGPSSMRRYRA